MGSMDTHLEFHATQLTQTQTHLLDHLDAHSDLPRNVFYNDDHTKENRILSLRKKSHSRFRAFRFIASASWGPSKESLCTLYKAFIRPILTYASPGWFSFSSPNRITSMERMHRSSCRSITVCLSSTPIPLLHIEALLPPLRVTLTHQSLSFFERALRLPSTFPIASLANSNPRTHLKKSSWRSFSRSHNLTLTYILPVNL